MSDHANAADPKKPKTTSFSSVPEGEQNLRDTQKSMLLYNLDACPASRKPNIKPQACEHKFRPIWKAM